MKTKRKSRTKTKKKKKKEKRDKRKKNAAEETSGCFPPKDFEERQQIYFIDLKWLYKLPRKKDWKKNRNSTKG